MLHFPLTSLWLLTGNTKALYPGANETDMLATFVKLKRNYNITLYRVIPNQNTYYISPHIN